MEELVQLFLNLPAAVAPGRCGSKVLGVYVGEHGGAKPMFGCEYVPSGEGEGTIPLSSASLLSLFSAAPLASTS